MKRNVLIMGVTRFVSLVAVCLSLCVLGSCTSSADEEPLAVQKSRVRVNVSPFHFIVENGGALSRSAISEAATRLSFAVFKSDGTWVGSAITQESTDSSFGTIELKLDPGTYKLLAVAHNGEADAVIRSLTAVTLPGITFTDTFVKVEELTVQANQDSDFSMELPRVTSAFVLRLTDTPPAQAKEIEVVLNRTGLAPSALELNPSTGLAAGNYKQTVTIPIDDLEKDVPVYFISIYPVCAVQIKTTAYDTSGNEIISHTFNDVSLTPNQKTIATGHFFKSEGTGSFTINSEWSEDQNIEY